MIGQVTILLESRIPRARRFALVAASVAISALALVGVVARVHGARGAHVYAASTSGVPARAHGGP